MQFRQGVFYNFFTLLITTFTSMLIIAIIGRSVTITDFGIYNFILRFLETTSYIFISISLLFVGCGVPQEQYDNTYAE
ncbi:MAG: hypothetical protein ACFFDN_50735, partial [Candidatus Hodarchaeota archaeon]